MKSVIVELKIKTGKNDLIFSVVRCDSSKKDSTVETIVNEVGGLVVEKKRHRNI